MITPQDKELLENKGISEEQIAEQLACFEKRFSILEAVCRRFCRKRVYWLRIRMNRRNTWMPGRHIHKPIKWW